MVKIGRSLRWYNRYESEIEFNKSNGFDFMQIWFKKGKLLIDNVDEPVEVYLKKYGAPLIIHAVFEIDDFNLYENQFVDLVRYLGHTETLIHPVFPPYDKPKSITAKTIYELAEKIKLTAEKLAHIGTTLFIENNSKIDAVNYTVTDLDIVFNANPDVELLLDLAHIDSYEHLQNITAVKYPKMLHVSDKHFSVEHEHLPIGRGDLDFELIFSTYLKDFNGNIILEIPEEDSILIDSMAKIQKAMFTRL